MKQIIEIVDVLGREILDSRGIVKGIFLNL